MKPVFSTSALLVKKVDYGDHDWIVTFLSRGCGKITLFASAARRSRRRFGGVLELFQQVRIISEENGKNGLPHLKEAALEIAFEGISKDMVKTAYAGYWLELVSRWAEEEQPIPDLFELLVQCFGTLNDGKTMPAALSMFFHVQFLKCVGLLPNLTGCRICGKRIEHMNENTVLFELEKGRLVCHKCRSAMRIFPLSRGTVLQLSWLGRQTVAAARRLKPTRENVREALGLLEAFVPFHLEFLPKSLSVLHDMRKRRLSEHELSGCDSIPAEFLGEKRMRARSTL